MWKRLLVTLVKNYFTSTVLEQQQWRNLISLDSATKWSPSAYISIFALCDVQPKISSYISHKP